MDKTNGYETYAATFIRCRSQGIDGVGAKSVRHWAKSLPSKATVLDIGCGTGLPISKAMVDEGLTVYGIDASSYMVQIFKQNFPNSTVACEAVENSSFFNRQFDAIIAWGIMFLLPEEIQEMVIQKLANALYHGGKLLFTAPSQKMKWNDAITEIESISLGADRYNELLGALGLSLIEEFEDEGENHYYHAEKRLD
ncbi:class I SAM-dependent methyltransferase [Dyadobacter sp. CY107]|uniref:class I SAM-dependent methyltransferase n=1 Tax=Dyadobacter fanqingshengii TaxID=2906443 RepID=UPI001F1B5890|nr:class I SAM-dependent methyltransferase [Dyadobacter fanqingshengii]MCF2503781.1 class I SAM-dependent methyltransferase [Dyadobacter fanqingshengii]